MFAASLLVVAVVATYASLAAISLTAGGSLPIPTGFPGKVLSSLSIHWNAPNVKHLVNAKSPTTGQVAPLADIQLFDFGALPTAGSTTRQLSIRNPGSTVLGSMNVPNKRSQIVNVVPRFLSRFLLYE